MQLLNERAKKFFRDFVRSNYSIISYKTVIAGTCRYNHRCHYNAVHDAFKAKQNKIAMVIAIDDGYPIVHFLNWNGKRYIDNTLGEWSKICDFYFVKWVDKSEFYSVDRIMDDYKKYLRHILPLYIRLLSDYEC